MSRVQEAVTVTSWQDKDVLYRLLNEFIPSKVFEILPLQDSIYEIKWYEKEHAESLLVNDLYLQVTKFLMSYGVTVSWSATAD